MLQELSTLVTILMLTLIDVLKGLNRFIVQSVKLSFKIGKLKKYYQRKILRKLKGFNKHSYSDKMKTLFHAHVVISWRLSQVKSIETKRMTKESQSQSILNAN